MPYSNENHFLQTGVNPLTPGCPVKGHICLKKPAPERYSFAYVDLFSYRTPGIKELSDSLWVAFLVNFTNSQKYAEVMFTCFRDSLSLLISRIRYLIKKTQFIH